MVAVSKRRSAVVKYLLDHGARADVTDKVTGECCVHRLFLIDLNIGRKYAARLFENG